MLGRYPGLKRVPEQEADRCTTEVLFARDHGKDEQGAAIHITDSKGSPSRVARTNRKTAVVVRLAL